MRAVYVEIDAGQAATLKKQWPVWGAGVDLVVLESPYRSLLEPLLEYIEQVQQRDPEAYVTVVLPEFVPRRLWQHVLHNQHALLIKGALLFKPNVMVTSVPFHLGRPPNGWRGSDVQAEQSTAGQRRARSPPSIAS